MSSTAAHALLRQLQASFRVHMGELKYFDAEAGCELWMLSATDNAGERWTAKAEDYYQAACALAGLMGPRRPALVQCRRSGGRSARDKGGSSACRGKSGSFSWPSSPCSRR